MRRVVEEQLHSERVQERNQIGFLLGSKTNIEAHVVKRRSHLSVTQPNRCENKVRGLKSTHASTGEVEKALAEYREALRLDPGRAVSYANLADTCMALNRVDEAEQAISEARKRWLNRESYCKFDTG
jgi:tetratricopeptide (TPR) repeat protein